MLWHTKSVSCALTNFDPKKYNFMLVKFLMQMLQRTETLISYSLCEWKYEKKTLSKVGYFSKIAEIFTSTLTVQICQKQQKD